MPVQTPPWERGVQRGLALLASGGITVRASDLLEQAEDVYRELRGGLAEADASELAVEIVTMNVTVGLGARLNAGEPLEPGLEMMKIIDIFRRILNDIFPS